MNHILNYFEPIDDPRSLRNQKHPFMSLIGTTLLASLSGIDSFSGFADFTESHFDALCEYFEFPHGPPSHDTYQRFWDALEPVVFYKCFEEFTGALAVLPCTFIHMDGKTIRHSGSDKALHIVSAWCQANQLTLAQAKVNSKSNEITALPKLLALLDLKKRIVTLDAMGTQRDSCAQIIEQGGDYVISLKGNQGTLHQEVADYFHDASLLANCLYFEENDKGHGRIEQRTAYVCESIDCYKKNINGLD